MARLHAILLASAIHRLASARQITFPPISGLTDQQIFGHEKIDIRTGSAFAGLLTYANLPYVHCLAAEGVDVQKYDIAILGAPFDTVR
jgi:agmatinase